MLGALVVAVLLAHCSSSCLQWALWGIGSGKEGITTVVKHRSQVGRLSAASRCNVTLMGFLHRAKPGHRAARLLKIRTARKPRARCQIVLMRGQATRCSLLLVVTEMRREPPLNPTQVLMEKQVLQMAGILALSFASKLTLHMALSSGYGTSILETLCPRVHPPAPQSQL